MGLVHSAAFSYNYVPGMYDPSYSPCAYTLYVLVPALTLPIACMMVHVLTLVIILLLVAGLPLFNA